MALRVRTVRDVRVFSVTLTAAVMLGSLALQYVLIPSDLAYQLVWPGGVVSFMVTAPLTYFFGLRLYDIHLLNVTLEQAAQFDPITGLLNRTAFLSRIEDDLQCSGVVIMADIDHFKLFNDTYGHALGDLALKQVARTFLSSSRAEDLVARFGGEEFVLFLPETRKEDGLTVAERLRLRLEQSPVKHNGHSIPITASFGVATLDAQAAIEAAMARADAALYEAKGRGRNCAVAAP